MNRHVKKIYSIFKYPKKDIKLVCSKIEEHKKSSYIVFYNPECIGIMNSVKEIFTNTISLKELFNEKAIEDIAECIAKNSIKQVIFATASYGYQTLAEKIKEKNSSTVIKYMWHGSHSLFVNRDEEYFLESILDLEKRGIVSSIGFLKESMAKYYKLKGYNAFFVMNTVNSVKNNDIREEKDEDNNIKIGIYSSGDRWEKNTYNQLSACSLVSPDLVVDSIPETSLFKSYCTLMNIKYIDEEKSSLSRDELLKKMSQNTLNLYVTFTECAPMIPLESFEVGVPCIVGDNNHYFMGTDLEEYLVVKSEDSIDEIAEKMKLCIENRDKIMKMYKVWKREYDIKSKESVNEFLKSK